VTRSIPIKTKKQWLFTTDKPSMHVCKRWDWLAYDWWLLDNFSYFKNVFRIKPWVFIRVTPFSFHSGFGCVVACNGSYQILVKKMVSTILCRYLQTPPRLNFEKMTVQYWWVDDEKLWVFWVRNVKKTRQYRNYDIHSLVHSQPPIWQRRVVNTQSCGSKDSISG
jgi:hypothetical protein